MTELEKAKQYFIKGGIDYYLEILQMESSTNVDALLMCIENFVKSNNDGDDGISTSQLRNIYAKAKRVKTTTELKLMKPKLAYVSAREKKPGAKQMIALFNDLITKVSNDSDMKNFIMFFESVVAYHKFFKKEN